MQGGSSKGANHNGYDQIIRPGRGMRAGLKILVSAVQSRPSPPFISNSCSSWDLSKFERVTSSVTNSGTLQRIPA
jgi:hypothetical protein